MPRIDTLQQGNRIQPSSPVPIGSTGGARLQGEAIQGFGDQLSRAGIALAQFSTEADKEHNKVKLAALAENARAASIQAKIAGETEFKKPDGSDQLDVYASKYEELTKGALDQFSDPLMREQAAVILNRERNDKAETIANSVIKRKVDAIKLDRENVVGQKMSNIGADPFTAMQAIKENNETLDGMVGTYAPDEIKMLKAKEAKQLALHAVDSLIGNEKQGVDKFAVAEELVNSSLAESLGADTTKTIERIRDEKVKFVNAEMQAAERARKEEKLAREELQDSNARQLFAATQGAKSLARQAEVKRQAIQMVKTGALSQSAYNAAFKEPLKEATEYLSDQNRASYTKVIDSGASLEGMNDRIFESMQRGELTPNDATGLMDKIAAMKKANKSADSTLQRRILVNAENAIKKANGGIESELTGEILVPGAKGARARTMLDQMYRAVMRGEDPKKAADKLIANEYGEWLTSKTVPSYIVPVDEQDDYDTFKSRGPEITKKAYEMRKEGKVKEANKLVSNYQDRLKALEYKKRAGK